MKPIVLPCSHQNQIFFDDDFTNSDLRIVSVPQLSGSQVVYYLGPFCTAFHQSSGISNESLSLTQSFQPPK